MKLNTDEVYIVNARCNGAATILMAETGVLYAYGENNENRLGLGRVILFIHIKSKEYQIVLYIAVKYSTCKNLAH